MDVVEAGDGSPIAKPHVPLGHHGAFQALLKGPIPKREDRTKRGGEARKEKKKKHKNHSKKTAKRPLDPDSNSK
jgi:hypothetical protein